MIKLPLRTALRVEGDWWVAYLALPDTMTDAKEMGRVRLEIVKNNPDNKALFVDLMKRAMADVIEDVFDQQPEMLEQPAPEHERSGRA